MGFKSSVAIAQTTRFKKKLYSSQNRNNPFTPPATPFNNTSFLIQLQQRREQGYSAPTSLRFDQYGSMENMISCCSFATSTTSHQSHPHPPNISGPSTSQSSNLISISQITGSYSPHGQHTSQICDSDHHEPQQLNFCSDDASSAMRPKLGDGSEIREEDHGVLRHRQRFTADDNFDAQCADSGSQTGTFVKKR